MQLGVPLIEEYCLCGIEIQGAPGTRVELVGVQGETRPLFLRFYFYVACKNGLKPQFRMRVLKEIEAASVEQFAHLFFLT